MYWLSVLKKIFVRNIETDIFKNQISTFLNSFSTVYNCNQSWQQTLSAAVPLEPCTVQVSVVWSIWLHLVHMGHRAHRSSELLPPLTVVGRRWFHNGVSTLDTGRLESRLSHRCLVSSVIPLQQLSVHTRQGRVYSRESAEARVRRCWPDLSEHEHLNQTVGSYIYLSLIKKKMSFYSFLSLRFIRNFIH